MSSQSCDLRSKKNVFSLTFISNSDVKVKESLYRPEGARRLRVLDLKTVGTCR
jgi:hypothetical protein